jgi:predicted phosphate transport protein (TIGR00153 family)
MALTKNVLLFRNTSMLERQIEEFLDRLSESALLFDLAIKSYLRDGPSEDFIAKRADVNNNETAADKLRREIETQLYTQTLIPESRGDVLGLIETLDHTLNLCESCLWAFDIEQPEIPETYHALYLELTEMVVQAVEALSRSSRAFFRDFERVSYHNHKVMFYEKEADKVSTKLKRAIFASDLELAHKIHLRYFVENIDNIADWAEDVADRLAIYAIKRSV